jgi:hypothetical protein
VLIDFGIGSGRHLRVIFCIDAWSTGKNPSAIVSIDSTSDIFIHGSTALTKLAWYIFMLDM